MTALALALAVAWGPGDVEENRLPLSLSESFAEEPEILVGGHLGFADSADGADPAFLVGFAWRIHILPWLGVAGSIDVQTEQEAKDLLGADFSQIPIEWALLLSPPIDLGGLRFHGQIGGGLTVTSITGPSIRNDIDLSFLALLGFGAELRLSSGVLLAVDVRYIWAQDPPNTGAFDADWTQITAGLLFKMPR